MQSVFRRVGFERTPSHLFGLTTKLQWNRNWIGNHGNKVKWPGRAVDHHQGTKKKKKKKGATTCNVTPEPVARVPPNKCRIGGDSWRISR